MGQDRTGQDKTRRIVAWPDLTRHERGTWAYAVVREGALVVGWEGSEGEARSARQGQQAVSTTRR